MPDPLLAAGRLARTTCVVAAFLWAPFALGAVAGAGTGQSLPHDQLQEVTVTATRRKENLQRVPISVVAMTQADLVRNNVKSIADLAPMTPGVEFDQQTGLGAGSVTDIAIRGIEPTAGDSTTGIYIDDTPIQARLDNASAFGNPYPLVFDLERVEVLRGPQGTLFGAGAEGGAIRFIQSEPNFTETSGHAEAAGEYTKYGAPSYEAGAAAGGPIVTDTLAFRASAWYRRDGGYVDRVDPLTQSVVDPNANHSESSAGRLAVGIRPISSVTITPAIYWQRVVTHDTSAYFEYLSTPGDLRNGRLLQQPANDSFYLGSLKVAASLGFADLVSVSSYFDRHGETVNDDTSLMGLLGAAVSLPLGSLGYGDPRGPAFPTSYADAAPQPSQIFQRDSYEEIRLASPDPNARLTWVAGFFYGRTYQADPNQLNDYFIPNPPATSQPVLGQNVITVERQTALFGQVDWALLPRLKASVGARAEHGSVTSTEVATGFIAGNPQCCYTQRETEHPVTPRYALSYQYNDRNLFYVSAAKGFRLGGGNVPTGTTCAETGPLSYKSDSLWSFEAGAKHRSLNDRFQMDASVFHIIWNNIQQNILLADCGNQYVTNAGKAVSNGFDMSSQALLTSRLSARLALSYQKAYFTETVDAVGGNSVIVQSGDALGALPQVPSPWNVTLGLDYRFSVAGFPSYIDITDIFHSKNPGPFATQIPGGVSYEPDLVADPGTNMLNLRLGLSVDSLDWAIYVNNALNSQPRLGRWVDVPGSTLFTARTFRPLTVGASVDWSF